MGLKAVNNPAESVFATFTKALNTSGQVGLDEAAWQGQARYNNNMGHDQAKMVTSRKSNSKTNKNNAVMGLFHTVDEDLTNSLVLTCRQHSKEDRRDFNKVLKRQEEVSVLMIQFSKEKKIDVTKSQWIGASYTHQKYNSPRCAMTAMPAFKEFNSLKSASAQYKWMRDQILI